MSSVLRLATAASCVVCLAALAGCGAGGAASSANTSVQQSAATLKGLDQSVSLANDAIVGSGTGSSLSAPTGLVAAAVPATVDFTFTNTGDIVVDLDGLDGAGHDKFPNATGRIEVKWNGAVVSGVSDDGLHTTGMAGYDVEVDYLTDCVFIDPSSGAAATIHAGGKGTYSLELDWTKSKTVADDWSITATDHLIVSGFAADALSGTDTWSETIDGHRDGTGSLVRTPSSLTASRAVVAHWDVALSHNGEHHTIVWDRPSIDAITITIDGVSYGPYTRQQLIQHWHARIDND